MGSMGAHDGGSMDLSVVVVNYSTRELLRLCLSSNTRETQGSEFHTVLTLHRLTLRNNTERPSTIGIVTNERVGIDPQRILSCIGRILAGCWKTGSIPPLWGGHAAERFVKAPKP